MSRLHEENSERGAILVIVLVLIFAVTLALLAYLYLNKNNTLIASNLAVQNAAQEATDVGLENASQWLNNQPNWPEITAATNSNALAPNFLMTMPSTGYSATAVTNSSPIQAPSDPSFWNNCAGKTCYSLGTISYGSFRYRVEYVIFPSGGMNVELGGNEQGQTGNTNGNIQSRYYVVFVHAMERNGGGLGVTVQAVLRKVMAS
ncbi:pilus assembly PilX family protein [Acidithiobacillus caldus]